MSASPDQYAVMGNPIAHSESPRIHSLFAAQTGQRLAYRAILVDTAPGAFAAAVRAFRDEGGKGLNVTLPFKQDAWVLAEVLSARAERAGAVNTLHFRDDGVIYGDNTDGAGLVRDLAVNHGLRLEGSRILLAGAGGAARGVLAPLLAEKPAGVIVANRSADKASELALRFSDLGPVSGGGYAELAGRRFDLIINATAAGLSDEVPPLPEDVLAAGGVCYDMVYGSSPTAFVRWGQAHGARLALDGLGMLVEQAAESFLLWRGVRPDTAPVLAALRGGGDEIA
ncbi:MAG TPA: shikimate dehydrogenase [Candidatus Competibacteraceae bacterium]|nr:shikimate dehydrogenase [Candidatus Competibacteraceae bacterium]